MKQKIKNKFTVVTREKMASEHLGTHRISVIFDEDTENGSIRVATELLEMGLGVEREIYKLAYVTEDTKLKDIVLITTPEVDPDERKLNIDEFTNYADQIGTADRLMTHDIFSITKEGFDEDAELKIGYYVGVPHEGNPKKKLLTTDVSSFADTLIFGKIIDISNGKYAIQVGDFE